MPKPLKSWCRVCNKIAILVAIFTIPALQAHSTSINEHQRVQEALALLEVWLEARRDYDVIPGLSAAIVFDQEILWSGGFGLADPDQNIAADSDTIYGICSISKLFTSIAVMQLRDRGRLRLHDDVSELLPQFAVNQVFSTSGPITVNGLLTHTAGLPAQVNTPNSTPPDFRFPSREELFQLQAEQETLFPASTHYEYSNLGISLLGEIISILSGESFESYIQKQLLDPLNLNDTSASIPVEETGSRLAVGHSARQRDGRRSRVGPYDAKAYAPALGFASTVNDLAAFASWQFRVLDGNDNKVIDANTLREMYRPHFMLPGWESAQGLGFEVDTINGTVYVGHSGTCPGYVSRLQIEPNTQIATIIMANANNVDVWNIATKMHEIFAPAIEEATASIGSTKNNVATPVKANIEPEQLQDYVGLYDVWPWNADTAFIAWKGQLSALRLSSINPVQDLRHWKHISGDVFRRIRSDGLLAEAWTFERDSSGNVVRVKVYGDYIKKIR